MLTLQKSNAHPPSLPPPPSPDRLNKRKWEQTHVASPSQLGNVGPKIYFAYRSCSEEEEEEDEDEEEHVCTAPIDVKAVFRKHTAGRDQA